MGRNREFRVFARLFLLVAAILTGIGFYFGTVSGMLVLITAFLFGCLFFLATRARYQQIAQISEQIDRVLHNEDHLFIDALEEGELSVLQSEIAKMTLRIREQNAALQKEKENLADSLADIAHQLRTPLTAATLLLTLAKDKTGDKEQKGTLREIEVLLFRMDGLITALLKLSRLDADVIEFHQEKVNLQELIDRSLRPFLVILDLHEIQVERAVPSTLSIYSDPIWLSEAIQNIVKNCIESIGDQGEITVSATENPLYTELTIHDSGEGFEASDLRQVFERFYQGQNGEKSGFGIGMSLSHSIIKRQGGTIVAKNHPDGGALFVLRFPK
ncbi:HAMP domain-containing sensor histidine kinase [uncultured Enterococcus sp.]|uniref:sensor histidine kinase n=1 Tax=uncultured Enterococcus sp. TaxID=167972 RepID=UPI00259094F5|nr:HAMP domain-containing sensor histidine kinase [uncultured Enterococcus sp.]